MAISDAGKSRSQSQEWRTPTVPPDMRVHAGSSRSSVSKQNYTITAASWEGHAKGDLKTRKPDGILKYVKFSCEYDNVDALLSTIILEAISRDIMSVFINFTCISSCFRNF